MGRLRTRALAVIGVAAVAALIIAPTSGAWTPDPTQGCTPGYWKNHTDAWVTYTPDQTVDSVFTGADPSLGSAALLDALNFQGGSDLVGKEEILLRAGVAALLNTTAGIDYGVSPKGIVTAVNKRLATQDPNKIIKLATELNARNNLACPLS
jgi:hypothetical protein